MTTPSTSGPRIERNIAARTVRRLSAEPPDIQLHHGSAMSVLAELGLQGDVSRATFNEYIKSLRKLGLPFAFGRAGTGSGRRATYSYEHIMELALALSLRVYNSLPDAVLLELIRHRPKLTRIYREAYRQRSAGRGRVLRIRRKDCAIRLRGVFLDLQIKYSGGRLMKFGPPRILEPPQALEIFANSDDPARAFLPIKISALAERVVALSLRAPTMRHGPQMGRAPSSEGHADDVSLIGSAEPPAS